MQRTLFSPTDTASRPAIEPAMPGEHARAMVRIATLATPLGRISVAASDDAVHAIDFGGSRARGGRTPLIDEAIRQLEAYFAGRLQRFDLPLDPAGTEFQKRVWHQLRQIRYGTTTTYGALAARIGNPQASRAVGGANHNNPIGIVIPCHRVVGASGALTGYASGLERKAWLLDHEQRHSAIH